jgi:SAM-dependent methyltransferase
MTEDSGGTWHYGLVARWWAEFNVASPEVLAYFRGAIQRFGEPAIDLGCGTGRILIPLVREEFDVDGVDVSSDMIAAATDEADRLGVKTSLRVQPLHELDSERRYRTAFMCGVFGLGGRRDRDRLALLRIHELLEPDGALLIAEHELPYAVADERKWARWLPGHRADIPGDWSSVGERRATKSGDEIELETRLIDFSPLEQVEVAEIRARLWRGGTVVKEEIHTLSACLYFAQEIRSKLEAAGFSNISVESDFTGRLATPDDQTVAFLARP